MKLALSTVFLSAALAAPAVAQSAPDAPPAPTSPGMHFDGLHGPHGLRGHGMFGPAAHRVEPVTNSPFKAQFTETDNFIDREGKQVQRSSTNTVYRDSEGRVRQEVTLPAPPPRLPAAPESGAPPAAPAPPRGPHTMITILDPVAHTITHLNPDHQTASVQTVPANFFTRMQQRGERRESGQQPQRRRDDVTTTDLGSRVFAGVPAKGEQTAVTLPARDGGVAYTITRQSWFSPDAKIEVSSSETSDRGTRSDTLTSFSKAEPNPGLFQVPAGYTTTTVPEGRFPGHHLGGPGRPGRPDGSGQDDVPPPPPSM